MKHFLSDVEAQDATRSDRRAEPVGGDLGEFPCGKRWASLRGNADPHDARCATLTAAAELEARWPDLQWGCAPEAGHRAGSQREEAGKPCIVQGKLCTCCPCVCCSEIAFLGPTWRSKQANMGPSWAQDGSFEASWRPLGGQVGFCSNFKRSWALCWAHVGGQNGTK